MNDLLEKLEAAIAETERIALAADPGPWEVGPSFGARDSRVYVREQGSLIDSVGSTYIPSVFTSQVSNKTRFRENAVHVALNDPERVLRRVARDRKLLDEHEHFESSPGNFGCLTCAFDNNGAWRKKGWCNTVLLLAEDYEIEVED